MEFNKYEKDGKVRIATEKAYNTLYKEQGYIPYKEKEQGKEEVKDISKMKKEDLILIATERGIEIPENATKEMIINLIKEKEKEEAEN